AAWLEWALMLQAQQDKLFGDPIEGAWFSTTGRDDSVLLRLKEDYDGAEPAASSVGAANLLTLSHLVFDGETRGSESHTRDFSEDIERTLRYFAARIAQSGRVSLMM